MCPYARYSGSGFGELLSCATIVEYLASKSRVWCWWHTGPSPGTPFAKRTFLEEPENDVEYVFSNICLTLALLTNAVIIGSATNLLSNMDAGAVAKKTQMDGINGYMRFRKARRRSACLCRTTFVG